MKKIPPEGKFVSLRREMVVHQMLRRGIRDQRVLRVMETLRRHLFVPLHLQNEAYEDHPLPVGEGQTISQPYIVALMTQLLEIQPRDVVLEIGTGTGYQTALLAALAARVFSVEIREPLAREAQARLKDLQIDNACIVAGDGKLGLPEHAPYDKILVTAAPAEIPAPLLDQLKEGGRMVVPVGECFQELVVVTKDTGGTHREPSIPVRFVPMV